MPAFIRVLNHFGIKFLIIHDRDNEKETFNNTIKQLAEENNLGKVKLIVEKLEDVIGLDDVKKDKPIIARQKIEELHKNGKLPKIIKPYTDFIFPKDW